VKRTALSFARLPKPPRTHAAATAATYALADRGRSVVRVAGGEVVHRSADPLTDVAVFGPDRYLVACGREGTVVLDVEALARGPIAKLPATSSWPQPSTAIGPILDGRALWLRRASDRETIFVSASAGKLVRLGSIPLGLIVEQHGTALLGRTHDGWIRIDGLVVPASAPAKPRKLALRPVTDHVPFPSPSVAWRERVRREVTFWRVSPAGRFVVYDGNAGELVWLDDKQRPKTFKPATMVRNFDVDDRPEIVVATSQLVTILDAHGKRPARDFACAKAPDQAMGVAFAAGELLAVLTNKALRLVDRRGRLVHAVAVASGRSVQSMRGGRWLIVSGLAKHKIQLFEVVGKKLVARFRDPMSWSQSYVIDDRYFVQATSGAWFELDVPR
jgi:hypothetical protein